MYLWQKFRNVLDQLIGTATCHLAGVTLGHRVRFRGVPIISRVAGSQISLGSRCVLISDSRHTALGVRGPTILRTIGARSIICKGVTIGRNAVIGVGSVVTHSVPENTIYAGSPATFIRKLKLAPTQ